MEIRTLWIPFACGVIFAPLLILLHEGGHYASARVLGYSAEFTFSSVSFKAPEKITKSEEVFTAAAGPIVELTLVAIGLLWLSRLDARPAITAPSVACWIATTCCTVSAGRWLRCFTGTPADPKPGDEAFLSSAMGLPAWFLPYALAPFAIIVIARAVSYHPSGMRLVPFSSLFAGGLFGVVLWLFVAGPMLLPHP